MSLKLLKRDVQKKLEQEINDLKSENAKEKQFLSNKMSQLEFEKSEMEVREKNLRASLVQIKEDKEKFEQELRAEWQAEKEANSRIMETLKDKLSKAEEDIKEAERKIYLNNSEFEKQKALLTQKADYYEKTLRELSEKEQTLVNEVKTSQKEHLSHLKENSQRYETLTKNLQNKVDQLEEKVSELEV